MAASAYLVLASQRSGSTLLIESLRATGVAGEPGEFFQYLPTTSQSPQPRQWFEGVEDESILRLLDPLDEGRPELAPPEIWRDYIRTVGRTPNGIWGGKLMWNQSPLLLQRADRLPDRSGDGLITAIHDVLGTDPSMGGSFRSSPSKERILADSSPGALLPQPGGSTGRVELSRRWESEAP